MSSRSEHTDDSGVSVALMLSPVVQSIIGGEFSELIEEGVDVPPRFLSAVFVVSSTNSYSIFGRVSKLMLISVSRRVIRLDLLI